MTTAAGVHQANEYRDDIFFPDANTTFADRLEASIVVGGGSVLFAAGAVEAGGAIVGGGPLTTAIGSGKAATAAGSVCSAACADGDCTNEINTGTNVVYQSVQNGIPRYIGITNNFARRAGEHYYSKTRPLDIEPIPGLDKLSRYDARAVEQALIENYKLIKDGGTLLNMRNSIAKANPIYSEAIERGNEILEQIGFFAQQ
jgi:hypothetical protein